MAIHLIEAIARIAEHEEKARVLRDSVVSALIYPAILVTVAGVSLAVLLAYVVPQFTALFADAGRALPVSTQIVIGTVDLLRSSWPLLVLGAVACALVLRRYRRHGIVLRIPLVGELVKRIETARLSASLAALLASGVSLLAALSIARDIVSNRLMSEALELAEIELRRRNVRLSHYLAARLPKLMVDPILIEQVLVNLLRNAAESIEQARRPPGRRSVELRVIPKDIEGQQVVELDARRVRRERSRPVCAGRIPRSSPRR